MADSCIAHKKNIYFFAATHGRICEWHYVCCAAQYYIEFAGVFVRELCRRLCAGRVLIYLWTRFIRIFRDFGILQFTRRLRRDEGKPNFGGNRLNGMMDGLIVNGKSKCVTENVLTLFVWKNSHSSSLPTHAMAMSLSLSLARLLIRTFFAACSIRSVNTKYYG